MALLTGLGIAILIGRFERAGHEHGPADPGESSAHSHDYHHAHEPILLP